jgi:type I restriction enzyme S subunit
MGASESLGTFVSLIRGTTYKGVLVGSPGPALLGLGSITPGGGFREGDFKTYGGDCPEKLLLGPGDLFVSLKGATKDGEMIGSIARVPTSVPSGRLTQDTVKLDFKSGSTAFRSYIYWLLRTPHYRQYCAARATGSAVVALSRDDFLAYAVPPLDTARGALVTLFDAVEEKIRLNRRMCQTLEEMARALFKSWFVENPKPTWRTAPLGEWVVPLSGGTPSKADASLWGGPLKWISPKAMTSIHADECEDHVTADAVGRGTRIAVKGSTLVMVRGMGLHDGVRVSQAREDVTFNQDVKALVPKHIHPDLLLFAILDAQSALHQRVESSGHGTGKLPSELLLAHPITMPTLEEQAKRGVTITEMNERIAIARQESRALVALRDTLLPNLISGEVRVGIQPQLQLRRRVANVPGEGRGSCAIDVAHEPEKGPIACFRPLVQVPGQGGDRVEQIPSSHSGSVHASQENVGRFVSQFTPLVSIRVGGHEVDGIGRHPVGTALLEEPCLASPEFVHAVRDPRIAPKVRNRLIRLGSRGATATEPSLSGEPLPGNPVRQEVLGSGPSRHVERIE